MKPDWDKLGDAFESSSSVVIVDVDCTSDEGKPVCNRNGVSGYPTIKYFTAETGKEGESYQGGRDFDTLKKFVEDELESACDVADPSGCTEKEQKYITKMKEGGGVEKQLARLKGMIDKPMKPELKAWVAARINILAQLAAESEKEEL